MWSFIVWDSHTLARFVIEATKHHWPARDRRARLAATGAAGSSLPAAAGSWKSSFADGIAVNMVRPTGERQAHGVRAECHPLARARCVVEEGGWRGIESKHAWKEVHCRPFSAAAVAPSQRSGERSPGADVAAAEPGPGADVAGGERSPGVNIAGVRAVPV
jgi:hypothetical protein